MRAWVLFCGAVVSEVAATLGLRAALDQPWWYPPVVLGYLTSFAFLAAVLRAGMPLGVAYGTWGACGVAATAALSTVAFGERLTPQMVAGLVLVAAGVLLVQLGNRRAGADR